jgi:tetratricopeptide (TPR) repeat protein
VNGFVGRAAELSDLRTGMREAIDGRTQLFLLVGEPGIGKTRIASEISAEARENGFSTVWAACCDGVGAPSYWPFLQIIRTLDEDSEVFHSNPLRSLSEQLGSRLVESYDADRQPFADPEASRFRLFDATAVLLGKSAKVRPLLLIVDDFHEADDASWLMLRFIAKRLRDAPLMIVVIYRETETSSTQVGVCAELCRVGLRLSLRGLSESEAREIVLKGSGGIVNSSFASVLHHATGGNPFFITEVMRVLRSADDARGGGVPIPDSIRISIKSRLGALPAPVGSTLAAAAVIGTHCDAGLLAQVTNQTAEQLRNLIGVAIRAGVLLMNEVGQYSFAHALLREVVYEELGDDRAKLHLRIANILEQRSKAEPTVHLDELAYHFIAAADRGDSGKAIDYACKAGAAAYAAFGYERAASHWQSALALLERGGDRGRIADLLQRLGDAYAITEVDRPKAIDCLEQAVSILERLGRIEEAAYVRAKLGMLLSRRTSTMNIGEAMRQYRLAEQVLAQLPATDSQALLYIGLAQAAMQAEHTAEGFNASLRAMEICRELHNDSLWVVAAANHSDFLYNRANLAEAFTLSEQAWQTADRLDDLNGAFEAAWSGGYHPLGLWDPHEALNWFARELSRPRLADATYQRTILMQQIAFTHVLLGNLEKAREILVEAPRTAVEALRLFYAGDWQTADRLLDEAGDAMLAVGSRDGETIAGFFRGQVKLAMGDLAAAEALNTRVLRNAFEGPVVPFQLNFSAQAALIAVRQGNLDEGRSHIKTCREILAVGEDFRGFVGRVNLAEAAVLGTGGAIEEADALCSDALKIFRRYDLAWEEAEAHFVWGETMLKNQLPERAAHEFDLAHRLYAERGAGPVWIDRIDSARGANSPSLGMARSGQPFPQKPEIESVNIFRCEGDYWTIVYRGRVLRLKTSKGMHYVAQLLERPGENVAAPDLRRSRSPKRVSTKPRDASRPEQSESRERARIAVTKAIKSAIEKIRRADPALARLLAITIRTGHACEYDPDPESPALWNVRRLPSHAGDADSLAD